MEKMHKCWSQKAPWNSSQTPMASEAGTGIQSNFIWHGAQGLKLRDTPPPIWYNLQNQNAQISKRLQREKRKIISTRPQAKLTLLSTTNLL